MFIFHELKLIYIMVPKTGTNSFWRSLSKKYTKTRVIAGVAKDHPVYEMEPITLAAHFTARQVKTLISEEVWNSYEKVGFVRHPYDWVISYFNVKAKGKILGEDGEASFGKFIRGKLRMTPFYWFLDKDGQMLIDTVYRTEDLKEILEGYGCEPLHANKTGIRDQTKDLTVELLHDEYKRVIKKRFWREMAYY